MKLKNDFGVTALLVTIALSGAVLAGLWLVFSGTDSISGMSFLANAALAGLGFYVGKRSNGN